MDKKVILITGANRGIGFTTARFFLKNGWKIIGTYRGDIPKLRDPNFYPVPLDISKSNSIRGAINKIAKLTPAINVLINNAAVNLEHGSIAEIDTIRKVFEINLFGLIDFTEQLLAVRQPRDFIINISSRKSLFATPIDRDVLSGYRMSKAALNMYTRTLAYRLNKKSIKVISYSPGWVKTDMGYSIATKSHKPKREVLEIAKELYKIANAKNIKSGSFWTMGKSKVW